MGKKGYGSWISSGISRTSSKNGLASLGPEGNFLELHIDENKIRNNILKENDGRIITFRFIKLIDDILYAGGTNNYLFNFVNNQWQEIGIDAMHEAPRPRSFDKIVGFNSKELYAFGWEENALWTNSKGEWKSVATPTKHMLKDGDIYNAHVYIAGQLGTILKGREDKWEINENNVSRDDIWSVCTFEDAIYFSTRKGILRLKNDKLILFKQLGPDMRTIMNLFVGPSGLWSIGESNISLFDGEKWSSIEQN